MESNLKSLGERLRMLRQEADLTQKELAAKISLTPKMISFYENDQRIPPADVLIKLADIFNITIDYLLGRTNRITLEEEELLSYYRHLNARDQHWLIGKIIDLDKKSTEHC